MNRGGLGCMRLSRPGVERTSAVETIHAALNAGVRWLDTADVYGPDARSVGHNEELIREALGLWRGGDPSSVTVATKGGLVRKGPRWEPDGRARHLRAACEASLERLGTRSLAVYSLHLPPRNTSFETSVRALARLKKAGLVEALGLSNVTVDLIERAREIVSIDYVLVEMGLLSPLNFESGVAEHCLELGLPLVAHRPLGGEKGPARLRKSSPVRDTARRLGMTPEDLALAWLYDLGASVVVPGAGRPDTARRAGAVLAESLDDEARAVLDHVYPHGRMLRRARAMRAPSPKPSQDVVVVMGIPAAGKSGIAERYERQGYLRLNRDLRGGRLSGLLKPLAEALAQGAAKVVLDNSYPSRASRNRVVETAWANGAAVRCEWVDVRLADAQVNAVNRMLDRHGRLLDKADISALAPPDPNSFEPRILHRYQEDFEAPSEAEGFVRVDRLPFVRRPQGRRAGIIIHADQHLWSADLEPLDGPLWGRLRQLGEDPSLVVAAVSWQPTVAAGHRSPELVQAAAARLGDRLGHPLDLVFCPHPPGPVVCWCRMPLPGLGALLRRRHDLDLTRTRFLGEGAAQRRFCETLGLTPTSVGDLMAAADEA